MTSQVVPLGFADVGARVTRLRWAGKSTNDEERVASDIGTVAREERERVYVLFNAEEAPWAAWLRGSYPRLFGCCPHVLQGSQAEKVGWLAADHEACCLATSLPSTHPSARAGAVFLPGHTRLHV